MSVRTICDAPLHGSTRIGPACASVDWYSVRTTGRVPTPQLAPTTVRPMVAPASSFWAAAATAAIPEMAALAGEPSEPPVIPVFRADHPFLFVIRDRESGAIFFLGRMTDPTRAS